jgi:hypothetical protein
METLGAVHTGAADDDEHKSFKHSCVCPERCFYALQRNAPVRRASAIERQQRQYSILTMTPFVLPLLLWLLYVLVINQTP